MLVSRSQLDAIHAVTGSLPIVASSMAACGVRSVRLSTLSVVSATVAVIRTADAGSRYLILSIWLVAVSVTLVARILVCETLEFKLASCARDADHRHWSRRSATLRLER